MQWTRAGALAAATAVGVGVALAWAVPASAHVEVSADNPQAGARNVTVTFTGEAESDSAGIVSERVVLPAGISSADVRLSTAPPGWTFTSAADGYTVAGPALKAGTDAVHSVVIGQLPADATELAFKVLESYSDGKVSRWIEVPQAGRPEPDNPAPVLKLKPAAAPPTSAAASSAVPSPTASPSTPVDPPVTTAADRSGRSALVWLVPVLVLAGAALAVTLLVRRRRRRRAPVGS